MSSHQRKAAASSRQAGLHHDNCSLEHRSERLSTSTVPGQENMPQGLNESYYRETAAALGIPMIDESRSHSVPPSTTAVVHCPPSPSNSSPRSSCSSAQGRPYTRYYHSTSPDNERYPDSLNQYHGTIQSNFSRTRAGVGAGIVGAVVGGLVAKQASEATFRHKQKQDSRARRHSSEATSRLASVVIGAVAGALGANAVTHRLEDARERSKNQQAWEKRHDPKEDFPYHVTKRPQNPSHQDFEGQVYDYHNHENVCTRDAQLPYDRPYGPRRHRDEESHSYHYRY
ncbi:hypothetical protein ED733_006763 [Metarhizium rileyi]|uniref:Glycine zipper 2TM domain-containing protein n=1 Tax=Metarhizium rileyi (strain RCEF 4871) TaxID=1649241 RepID=A0A5C6GCG3_METRR|nr:hypothetical protein ED733_006763 [Metarhizium rileyi]